MRYAMAFLGFFVAIGFVVSCSDSVEGEDNQFDLADHGEFSQFFWDQTSTCATGHAPFARQHYFAFRICLFLNVNGTGVVFYDEGFLGHGFNQSSPSPESRTQVDASWELDDEELVVGDVLRCTVEFRQERQVLACELQRAVVDDDAVGVVVYLAPRNDNISPDDTEFAEFSND